MEEEAKKKRSEEKLPQNENQHQHQHRRNGGDENEYGDQNRSSLNMTCERSKVPSKRVSPSRRGTAGNSDDSQFTDVDGVVVDCVVFFGVSHSLTQLMGFLFLF